MDNPYQKIHLIKRLAKGVLHVLNGILPRRVYKGIYFPTFAAYQASLRWRYRRRLLQAKKEGNTRILHRMERVYTVMPYSLIGQSGLEHTHDLAVSLVDSQIPGAFVECGIAQGGCAALLSMVAASDSAARSCWFFDSYAGLPDPTDKDFEHGKTGDHIRPLPRGSCLGTYEQVSQLLFDTMSLSPEHINLVKGWFQDTLPKTSRQIGRIALLRVDGDWYDSTRCCLENLYDQVSPGGYVIIDDYYSCYGARKATDEFLAKRGIDVELASDGRGGCSFQKADDSLEQTLSEGDLQAA